MRLIDLNKIPHKAFRGDRDDLVDALFAAPTVDAVPVVRCRDCVYGSWFDGYVCSHPEIRHLCNPDEFCSRGEHREEDNNEGQ